MTCILVFWFLWHLCCCIPPIRGTFESDRASERRAIGARCASVTRRKVGGYQQLPTHGLGVGRLHLGSQFLTSDLPALVCARCHQEKTSKKDLNVSATFFLGWSKTTAGFLKTIVETKAPYYQPVKDRPKEKLE